MAPYAVHRDADQLRLMPLELREELVEECQLVTTDRAPVGWVEDQSHRVATQVGEPQVGVRAAGECEVRCGSSWRNQVPGLSRGIVLWRGHGISPLEVGFTGFYGPISDWLK